MFGMEKISFLVNGFSKNAIQILRRAQAVKRILHNPEILKLLKHLTAYNDNHNGRKYQPQRP